ncbi:hypothetical protein [Marinicella meishanensis]|uniref:hypothetical protein n=1 Tax=Marinicella meishanensis TaxID=2873263 RepID=UPI001CBE8DED|nr:hypothetical protein [Marinicella sp. NBU2979]
MHFNPIGVENDGWGQGTSFLRRQESACGAELPRFPIGVENDGWGQGTSFLRRQESPCGAELPRFPIGVGNDDEYFLRSCHENQSPNL